MNKHRGSDFNQFLIEEGIMTPTPTPRTDAIAHRGLGSVAYIAQMTSLGRELERELADAREWSSKLADVADELRAELAEIAEWREMIDREVGTLREELATERELADRLADHLDTALGAFDNQEAPHVVRANRTLAAWKEARNGTC